MGGLRRKGRGGPLLPTWRHHAIRPKNGLMGVPKKNPSTKLGVQAYLLSHIKAPLREEKREVANHPTAIYQTPANVSSPNAK